MSNMDIIEEIKREGRRIKECPDIVLGKGGMMPFNYTNSGSRKLMQTVQVVQQIEIVNPEVAYVSTGWEMRYGQLSSSFKVAKNNYTVLNKIGRDHKYYIFILNEDNGIVEVIERRKYEHITEGFGYTMNTDFLDSLKEGQFIPKGTVLAKSNSFDEYNNRMDGVNLLTAYFATENTKEDSITISDVASKKLASPIIKVIDIVANDNDITLNIYGDSKDDYKSFPNIGEHTMNDILCALRREKKEESLYTQSIERLRKLQMPDTLYVTAGQVVDIDVYCNNPDMLNNIKYGQVKTIYEEQKLIQSSIRDNISQYVQSRQADYDVQKIVYDAVNNLDGMTYIKDNKEFSNVLLRFTILEIKDAGVGDKVSNRYGGKGVISQVKPAHLMPHIDGEPVDIEFNAATCVNRENPGQLFETSINSFSRKMLNYFRTGVLSVDECIEDYLKFLDHIVPDQGVEMRENLCHMSDYKRSIFIRLLCEEKACYITVRPISDQMSVSIMERLYDDFPYIKQSKPVVPIEDSRGNIRFIEARRTITSGYQYIYRLKQYAEEKFSAVSLAATNLKNENSRNSSKKNYKSFHSNTPIRFGEMEIGDLTHLGVEVVVENLLLYSASPHARRLAAELFVNDPFENNIQLNIDASNRSVEIMNAYLMAMGLKIEIIKIAKNPKAPITRLRTPIQYMPIRRVSQDERDKEEMIRIAKQIKEHYEREARLINPISRV